MQHQIPFVHMKPPGRNCLQGASRDSQPAETLNSRFSGPIEPGSAAGRRSSGCSSSERQPELPPAFAHGLTVAYLTSMTRFLFALEQAVFIAETEAMMVVAVAEPSTSDDGMAARLAAPVI